MDPEVVVIPRQNLLRGARLYVQVYVGNPRQDPVHTTTWYVQVRCEPRWVTRCFDPFSGQ